MVPGAACRWNVLSAFAYPSVVVFSGKCLGFTFLRAFEPGAFPCGQADLARGRCFPFCSHGDVRSEVSGWSV